VDAVGAKVCAHGEVAVVEFASVGDGQAWDELREYFTADLSGCGHFTEAVGVPVGG